MKEEDVEQRDNQYRDISFHRLAGMKAEADEDTEEAIAQYAECIRLGENADFDLWHAYYHAYVRIIVLLSRIRDYKREASYIEAMLKHWLDDKDRAKYEARLQKTLTKINKTEGQ